MWPAPFYVSIYSSYGILEDVMAEVERIKSIESDEPFEPSEPVAANGKVGWLPALAGFAILALVLYRLVGRQPEPH